MLRIDVALLEASDCVSADIENFKLSYPGGVDSDEFFLKSNIFDMNELYAGLFHRSHNKETIANVASEVVLTLIDSIENNTYRTLDDEIVELLINWAESHNIEDSTISKIRRFYSDICDMLGEVNALQIGAIKKLSSDNDITPDNINEAIKVSATVRDIHYMLNYKDRTSFMIPFGFNCESRGLDWRRMFAESSAKESI